MLQQEQVPETIGATNGHALKLSARAFKVAGRILEDHGIEPGDTEAERLLQLEAVRGHSVADVIHAIRNGLYGTCLHCKKRISSGRLDVLPTSVTCVPCQRTQEDGESSDTDNGAARFERAHLMQASDIDFSMKSVR